MVSRKMESEVYPKTRVFVNKRDRAFRTARMLNASGKHTWLVGISSESIPMFDLEEKNFLHAEDLAKFLVAKLKATVGIFETDKGFHIVAKRLLDREGFKKIYEDVIDYCKNKGYALDLQHAELSIKYGRTTLRISRKPNPNSTVPKLIKTFKYPCLHINSG
jgi:hypothetical protein